MRLVIGYMIVYIGYKSIMKASTRVISYERLVRKLILGVRATNYLRGPWITIKCTMSIILWQIESFSSVYNYKINFKYKYIKCMNCLSLVFFLWKFKLEIEPEYFVTDI